jgi:hypothetical protein
MIKKRAAKKRLLLHKIKTLLFRRSDGRAGFWLDQVYTYWVGFYADFQECQGCGEFQINRIRQRRGAKRDVVTIVTEREKSPLL